MKFRHITWGEAISTLANGIPTDGPMDSWMPPYWYRERVTNTSEANKRDIFRRQMPKRHPNNNNCPSYKDFVIALSGYGLTSNKITNVNTCPYYGWNDQIGFVRGFGRWAKGTRYEGGPGLWGRTFGAYRGKNGKPIAECRPLDSAFFQRLYYLPALVYGYLDARCFPESYRNTNLILAYHHYGSWGWCSGTFTDSGVYTNSDTALTGPSYWRPLPVGVYLAYFTEYYKEMKTYLDIGDANGNVIYSITGSGMDSGLIGENGIFFVDSPGIQWRSYWDCWSACIMSGFLARLVDSNDWVWPTPK